jgi:hypothetical protein
MAYLGSAVLMIIAMTVAANLHPEGPALVILLFWACPALFGGLFMLLGKRGSAAARAGGALLLLLGLFLMSLFLRIL